MHRVPIDGGPEIDLCRQCQLVWFDANELSEMPPRSRQDLSAERWGDELREIQRRREDSAFFTRIMLRHPMGRVL